MRSTRGRNLIASGLYSSIPGGDSDTHVNADAPQQFVAYFDGTALILHPVTSSVQFRPVLHAPVEGKTPTKSNTADVTDDDMEDHTDTEMKPVEVQIRRRDGESRYADGNGPHFQHLERLEEEEMWTNYRYYDASCEAAAEQKRLMGLSGITQLQHLPVNESTIPTAFPFHLPETSAYPESNSSSTLPASDSRKMEHIFMNAHVILLDELMQYAGVNASMAALFLSSHGDFVCHRWVAASVMTERTARLQAARDYLLHALDQGRGQVSRQAIAEALLIGPRELQRLLSDLCVLDKKQRLWRLKKSPDEPFLATFPDHALQATAKFQGAEAQRREAAIRLWRGEKVARNRDFVTEVQTNRSQMPEPVAVSQSELLLLLHDLVRAELLEKCVVREEILLSNLQSKIQGSLSSNHLSPEVVPVYQAAAESCQHPTGWFGSLEAFVGRIGDALFLSKPENSVRTAVLEAFEAKNAWGKKELVEWLRSQAQLPSEFTDSEVTKCLKELAIFQDKLWQWKGLKRLG